MHTIELREAQGLYETRPPSKRHTRTKTGLPFRPGVGDPVDSNTTTPPEHLHSLRYNILPRRCLFTLALKRAALCSRKLITG